MTTRKYRLLCPIARALDRLGDRWTLLILRDLHAGPARFSDLQNGLTGIASNLLANRLDQLQVDGLVAKRDAEFGVSVYELTALGRQTDELLSALGDFGSGLPVDDDVRRPGNLRVIAVTLKVALQRVVDPGMSSRATLVVDGERFTIAVEEGVVDVRYGAMEDGEVVIRTSYEPLVAVKDGDLSPDEFASQHIEVVSGEPDAVRTWLELLGKSMNPAVQGSKNRS